jgi:glycosyltransferase involved in cell wall biosynthesis
MKLIIQIPCLNEEQTLPHTLADLPRVIDGIDAIEWLIIDDGSTDRTVQVARNHGVHHIVSHNTNKGLAAAFQTGINACLQLGVDIIVNTDADNQYPGQYIPDLIRPILNYEADMVIGDRQVQTIEHFSGAKKVLQKLGSAIVRYVSATSIPDAPSGFRAMSRETALRLNVITGYTYTLETIIQAGKKNLTVVSIPITTNPMLRESRLIKSLPNYIIRSGLTILRLFMLYEPLRTFSYIALLLAVPGVILWGRYVVLMVIDETVRGAHIQSVIVGAAFIIIAFVVFLIGLVGELISINRRLHEEALYYIKRAAFLNDVPAVHALNHSQKRRRKQKTSQQPEGSKSR